MGKGQPTKKPKGAAAPFLKGAGEPARSDEDQPPAFSFERMQDGSGNSFNCCEDDDRLSLAKRIFMLSRIPWKVIRQTSASGFGAEQIPRYRINRSVPNSVTDDVQSFTSMHYVSTKRFIGYKVGRIFYVLWVDHNFKVYDH